MTDLTLIYYTNNRIDKNCLNRIQKDLLEVTENKYPIISVSQKPIDFGFNFCIGEIGSSNYNVYKQILAGLKLAKTEFVACCEDDTLYNSEHFTYRSDLISYNVNVWLANKDCFWAKRSGPMTGACIAPTQVLMDVLENRFKHFPDGETLRRARNTRFIEPGVQEHRFKNLIQFNEFTTKLPLVTFERRYTLGGLRKHNGPNYDGYDHSSYLEPFGDISDVWNKYWEDV